MGSPHRPSEIAAEMLASTFERAEGAAGPSEAASLAVPLSPARIGRYAVLRPLGEGGMGVVYAAYDEELDRKVAVKLLRSVAPPGAERRARLIREAQALARVSHPNVVSVYEVGEADGQVFIAMEFIDGATLTAWQASGPSWDEVLQMYRAAGEGLDAAHRAGLVHRDFKPDNVLVGKDGRARVADFGLARGLRSEESLPAALPGTPDRPALVSLTLQGAILGTPAYMSPEQHRGETADSRSDQWSFCAALYAALYGMAPFAGDTLAALSANVQAGRLRPAPAGSTVPARINAALRRGLAAAPEERYAAMAELLSALVVDPQRDPALAPMTRRSFIIPMVLGMGAMTVLMYLLRAQRWLTPARIVGSAGTLLLGVSGMAFGLRRSLRENAFHLGLVKLMILLLAQLFMVRGVGCLLGQGITHILAMEQVVLAGSFAVIALHFLPGCWAMAAASAAMALALVRWPETMMSLLACYYLLLTLALAGLWSHAAGGHPAIRDRAPALGARRAKDAS